MKPARTALLFFSLAAGVALGWLALGQASVQAPAPVSSSERLPAPLLVAVPPSGAAAVPSGIASEPASRPGNVSAGGSDWAALFEAVLAAHHDGMSEQEARSALQRAIALNPEAFRHIMRRWENEPELLYAAGQLVGPDAPAPLLEVLFSLARAGTPFERQFAFNQLAGQKQSEVAGVAYEALRAPLDPLTLERAVAALRPGDAAPSERSAMAGRLRALAQSDPDGQVRSQALLALQNWETNPAALLPALADALQDQTTSVRQAAIQAAIRGKVQAESLKEPLLRLRDDAAADISVRAMAWQALQGIKDMTAAERDAQQKMYAQLAGPERMKAEAANYRPSRESNQ